MQVLIHAIPKRLWYVNEFLIPSLREQGIEPMVYCDYDGKGNLAACLDSFEQTHGDCWHLQDDVLIARDFAERASKITGVANGFCHTRSGDKPGCVGKVYVPDLWNGFPCVRIPDTYHQEFVEWVRNAPHDSWQDIMIRRNRGDDFMFHKFMEECHGAEMVTNISLVEHIDWLIGGSAVNEWRGYICRSDLWDDEELVQELKRKIKAR